MVFKGTPKKIGIIKYIIIIKIEKKSKYKDLELEIQRMWQMKTEVIPVVVGALGTIKKIIIQLHFVEYK